jgi:osmotically-inducible protein OsmY
MTSKRIAYLSAAFAAAAACMAFAQQPDNTKVNERDKPATAVTPDQQGTSKADMELTAKIRKAIVDEKSLSTYAKNVKVITKEGAVVLRGPVRTQDERERIGSIAGGIAGPAHVSNQLEIAPSN